MRQTPYLEDKLNNMELGRWPTCSIQPKWNQVKSECVNSIWAVLKIEALIWVSFWRALNFQSHSKRVGSNPRRQSKNIEMKYQTHVNSCVNYLVHSSSTMWRIRNQPSSPTSCIDNALCLLVLVVVFEDWKMSIQSMNSTPNLFRLTITEASSVSRLSLVLLLLITQFYFVKPCSQTTLLVGITSKACHNDIRVDQLIMNSRSLPQNTQASCIPQCSQTEDNISTNSSNSALDWLTRSSLQWKCVTNWFSHCLVNVPLSNSSTR